MMTGNDIPFEEFQKTQYMDQSKIICDKCKTANKSESFKNMFYRCISCNSNLLAFFNMRGLLNI